MSFLEKAKAFSRDKMITEIMTLLPKFSAKNVIRMIALGEKITTDPEYKYNAGKLRELFEQGHPAAMLVKEVINGLSPN